MTDRLLLSTSLVLLAAAVATYDPVGLLPAAVLIGLAVYAAAGGGR